MVGQTPLLAAVPSGVLDMTTDFTPLLVGLVVGLGVGVLALAFMIGMHDTWEAKHHAQQVTTEPQPSVPKAA